MDVTDSIPSRWSATLPLFGLWKGYPSLNKCLYRVSGLPNYCIWPDSMESSLYSIEIQSLSPPDSDQRWRHQRPKYAIDLLGRHRHSSVNPPVQHENECRSDVPCKEVMCNLVLSRSAEILLHRFADDISEYQPQVLVQNGSPSYSNLVASHMSMLVVVLENPKTEPQNLLVPFARMVRRLHSADDVVDAAQEQFVLVAEVHVKS